MGKIKQLVTDFDDRLSKRKKKLDESVRLHRLIESALDWCIESAALLSENDVTSLGPSAVNTDYVKQEIDQYLVEYPAPTDEQLQELQVLMETSENHWAKENAMFAYNRVLEILDRFRYHRSVLEELIAEQRAVHQRELESKRDLVKKSKKVVRAVDTLINRVTGEDGDSSLDCSEALSFEASHVDSGDEPDAPSHGRTLDRALSLHYEHGLDEVLMLLETAAKNASDRISSQRASPPPGTMEYEAEMMTQRESESSSPKLSKMDISGPKQTQGALFTQETELSELERAEAKESSPCPEDTDEEAIQRLSLPVEPELAAQTKFAKHRRRIMDELISTEETYIRDLEHVVEIYMPAMDNLDELPTHLIGKKNIVFSNLMQLLQFNRLIVLPRLRECRKCPVKLGEIFLAEEEDFLNYSLYFKNMPQQSQLMEEVGNEFFTQAQQLAGDSFKLSVCLIKPFQRVSQYKLFLKDMIKYSLKSDQRGKLKEYHDKLKEAYKMVDFILRHGNDLLAVEVLKGFEGNMVEQGRILRQGDLTFIERTKHRRRVFLFENTVILAKKKKGNKHVVGSSDTFHFRAAFKASEFGLRESIPGHPTRFHLWKKRETLVFQAETEEEKNCWVQDIWDLFFSHMLQLKELNLEAHGSRPLTSIAASGSATITRGRALGHSMRRSLRYSATSTRRSQDFRSRPTSRVSNVSGGSGTSNYDELVMMRPMRGSYSPGSPRLSGTFVDLRAKRVSGVSLAESEDVYSSRSSMVSTSSSSTVTSLNVNNNNQLDSRSSRLVSDVQRAGESPVPPRTNEAEEEEGVEEEERRVKQVDPFEVAPTTDTSADTSTYSQASSQEYEEGVNLFETPV